MSCLLKRFLPFVITLILGIATASLHHTNHETIELSNDYYSPDRELTIRSMPEIDFTDEARRTNGFTASIILQARLNEDGSVSDIEPLEISPDEVNQKKILLNEHGKVTLAILNQKFVKLLPYGLTEASIKATKQIQFSPAISGGKPVATHIRIGYNFNLIISPDCLACSSITTTIVGDDEVRWQKTMYRANAYYHGKLPI